MKAWGKDEGMGKGEKEPRKSGQNWVQGENLRRSLMQYFSLSQQCIRHFGNCFATVLSKSTSLVYYITVKFNLLDSKIVMLTRAAALLIHLFGLLNKQHSQTSILNKYLQMLRKREKLSIPKREYAKHIMAWTMPPRTCLSLAPDSFIF